MALTKVTKTGISDNSIDADKIEDGTIVAADIAPGTITNAKLAGSIANDKLTNSAITVNGSSVSLGGSVSAGKVQWQSVVVSDGSTVTTMVAGNGYFVNNTSAAGLVKLPVSASAGDTIAIKDYAGNFGTNNLTIQRNGHNIQGVTNDSEIKTNRASLVLVYIDATKGWLFTNESNVGGLVPQNILATGGTVTTSGDFKIHSFTGDGCFVISAAGCGTTSHPSIVDYLVVAGGGGGSHGYGGGGGAGGFREAKAAASPTHAAPCHTVSPLAATTGITITETTYPITVGAGGAQGFGCNGTGSNGSNSVFSTITSTGGGAGGGPGSSPPQSGSPGGSGGGGGVYSPVPYSYNPGSQNAGGSGNTPPVSPSQGNNGGAGLKAPNGVSSGGGGGAGGTGGNATGPQPDTSTYAGDGGAGVGTLINPATGESGPSCLQYYSGGGGGTTEGAGPALGSGGTGGGADGRTTAAPATAALANSGGGGGAGINNPSPGSGGGSGIVVIRYKYQ
jgi:hypothetical protein